MKTFLKENQDIAYQSFNQKLIPNITKERIVGVRVPILRKKAKLILKSGERNTFVAQLPHAFLEEDLIHAYLINEETNLEVFIYLLNQFLPYVDNWAVCDALSAKPFLSYSKKGFDYATMLLSEEHTYSKRYGILVFMRAYLKTHFDIRHFDLVASASGDDYYLKMAKAWYFAESLAYHYEEASLFLKAQTLDKWTHNKAIQKARESKKLDKSKKEALLLLKRQ